MAPAAAWGNVADPPTTVLSLATAPGTLWTWPTKIVRLAGRVTIVTVYATDIVGVHWKHADARHAAV